MKNNFNLDWYIYDDINGKRRIDLPYDAMINEKRSEDCVGGVNNGYFPGGKYKYEKIFNLNKDDCSKKVFLHFEAVYQNCSVIVNDNLVKKHYYGFSPFDVDISDYIREDNNNLIVEVDNSLQPNCRWYTGSGIFRDVFLIIKEKDYIYDLKIETLSYNPAVINIDAKSINDSDIKVKIYDKEKIIYDGNIGTIDIDNAKLWDEDSPYLYDICLYNKHDEINLRYGIRYLEWNYNEGLLINGKSVLLRGACIHHDHGIIGANEYYDSEYRRLRIIKENGFNAIRCAHNQASKITLDICDEIGLYVMNESFDGWYIPKTYHDYSRVFKDYWKQDVEAMVLSSYNHPSVIIYSIGNEVSETSSSKGVECAKELKDYINSLDKTRPITAGINVLLNVYARMGLGVYKDNKEYKAEALENNKKYKEKKSGSAFFNAMAQRLGKLMFYMSKGSKGDKACKDVAEVLDILGLNYASSRYDEDIIKYPKRMMVGSETMVNDLPYNWPRVKKYPQLIGDFVWSGWDYLGEACIGDWTYPSYKGLPLLAGQGMIDITGKPLAAMYFMQIVWGIRKKPFIGISPLNHNNEIPHKGSWQFTNVIDSYSWDGYEGEIVNCEVYGIGDAVSLYLNDELIATKKYKNYKAYFKFKFQKGKLVAKSLDEKGNVVSESYLESGQEETILNIKTDKDIVEANKLIYMDVKFTDKNGNLKPYIEKEIKVESEGPIKLIGLGSALCKTDELYIDNIHNTYRGHCLAIFKADKYDGKAKIYVSSDNYETVIKEIEVKANV